jgi:hypothetical protein
MMIRLTKRDELTVLEVQFITSPGALPPTITLGGTVFVRDGARGDIQQYVERVLAPAE